ncbi:MAG: 2-amino-4-hydroxy-6-hydroxymethyldihydropteridine diphosphokinase [Actinomycetota bacterium]
MRTFIGLGSNLGDRAANLGRALEGLSAASIEVVKVSSFYDTDPVGVTDQPNFLNAACEATTLLTPTEVVSALKRVESEVGRTPSDRWGPREIDLDLLLYGSETIDSDDVVVPHPELTKRAFVLIPLLELDPNLELPSGEPLSAFCERDPAGVRRV